LELTKLFKLMNKKKIIFISGLHRSGTSLLYKILKQNNNISGLSNTNEIEDEGQHVQNIYKPAYEFGGVGRFGFDPSAKLDENSNLVTEENRIKLFKQWSRYWDNEKEFLLEKSPPNIIRTKFLQAMFPNSYFINLTRHPIATSLASKKWSKTSLKDLIKHWLLCHETFNHDSIKLKNVLNIKYEELIDNQEHVLNSISKFLDTKIMPSDIPIKQGINDKYFKIWQKQSKNIFERHKIKKIIDLYNSEVEKYDYSLINF